jgi:predicted transcriptional regulator
MAMAKRNPQVTETELAILGVLWEKGPATVREIVQALYREHTPALHATVGSLLERLAAKGHVAGDRSGFAHRYAAKIGRQAFVGEQLRQLAETHFGGSLSPMLLTLADLAKLKKSERDAIRKIVEGME